MRHLASEARAARHAAVLDEATLEFNRVGVAAASLNDIARRVGITRAGLYNYCEDRQDLVAQCYMRACSDVQADLERARQAPGDALAKVRAFLDLSLSQPRRPVAVITELGFLTPEQEASVREARQENARTLRDMMVRGVEDGSIRPSDHHLAAYCILGMLTWNKLRVGPGEPDETMTDRVAAVLPIVATEGMATDEARVEPCGLRIGDVVPCAGDESSREALARAGSSLFNRRGIDGSSLDEVAAELGFTKGAIYHHFKTKAAFVAYCYERAVGIYELITDAAGAGGTGLECQAILLELTAQAQLGDLHVLWPTSGLSSLPDPVQRRIVERINVLVGRSTELSRRGIVDGTLRPLDTAPMALVSASAHALLGQWLAPDEKRTPAQIAHEIGKLLFRGLRNRAGRDAVGHRKPAGAPASLTIRTGRPTDDRDRE
jgi:AcrR family transcriptional regulator